MNTIHPTGVNTPMVVDEAFGRFVQENPTFAENLQNPLALPNGLLEPEDITDSVMHLVSDAGRYITGSTVVVDAGFTNKGQSHAILACRTEHQEREMISCRMNARS